VIAIASLALVGWLFDVAPLHSWVPGRPPMWPVTAIGFIVASGSLLLLLPPAASRARRLAGRACALAVLMFGVLVVLEYALGLDLGVDLHIPGAAPPSTRTAPWRPAPLTAIAFTFVGLALLLLDSRRLQRFVGALLFAVVTVNLLAAAGHLYGVPDIHRVGGVYPFAGAIATTLAFLVLCLAVAAARPEVGWIAVLRSRALGGLMARPLVLASLLGPPLVGLAVLAGERAGLYESGVSLALLVASLGSTSLLLVSVTARAVNRSDLARRRVQEEQRALFDYASDGILIADRDGRFLDVNERGRRQCGHSRDEILRMGIADLVPPEEAPRLAQMRARVLAGGTDVEQWTFLRKDGSRLPVEVSTRLLPDGRWIWFVRDISERRAAEQALRMREAQLDAFFDASPAGMAILDLDLRFLKINEVLAAINGPSVAEHMGRTLAEVLPTLAPQVVTLFERIRETRKPILNAEVSGFLPNEPAVRRHWIVSYFPIGDGRGAVAFLGGVIVEVTELQRARETLQQQARDLQAFADRVADLYNNAPCGYHSIGRDGKFVQVNDTELRWLGYARDEIIGRRTIFDLLTDESNRTSAENLRDFLETGEVRDLRVEMVRKDGSILPVLANASAVRDADGRVVMSRTTLLDHTAQRKLEEELKSALRSRDEFLSVASHDLKTPLTSLTLQVQRIHQLVEDSPRVEQVIAGCVVEGRVVPDSLAKLSGLARRQVDRLSGLVDDLLDLTRIRVGRLTLTRAELDLAQAARDVVASLSPEMEALKIALSLHAAGPVRGSWDPLRVDQVLTNLVSNAIKYGRGQPIDVWVEEDAARRLARVRVVDRGIGIPPAQQALVFERLERAVGADTFKGLGLGLYITRRIVEAHGGTIRVDSVPNEGSTFTVELPL
jgi:PAS domain S-box-containing protein